MRAVLAQELLAIVDVLDHFTPAEAARADAYNAWRDVLRVSDVLLELIVVAALGLGAGARRLGAWSARVTRGRWVRQSALLVAVLVAAPWAVTLPLTIARHRLDRDYALATNPVPALLRDSVVGTGFSIVTSLIAAIGFLWIARRAGRAWALVTAAAGSAFVVLGVFISPLVYEPAFNRFTPADAATTAMVRALAADAGVRVGDVLVADASRRTSRRNAYVSGLGSSKRVVLYDTLLDESDSSDVRLVVAHELAHQKHRDVRNGTLLGVGGLWLAIAVLWVILRARAPSDPGILPALALYVMVATLLSLPVSNAISRRVEARADRTAIELTGDVDAAIRLEVNLARDNLSDLTPNPVLHAIFASHPSAIERIRAAEAQRAR